MTDDWKVKDIYLQKTGEEGFIGLHSMGMYDENGKWLSMEAWANQYSKERKFLGSIFRIFGPIEQTAEDMQQEGYTIVNNWELNENR